MHPAQTDPAWPSPPPVVLPDDVAAAALAALAARSAPVTTDERAAAVADEEPTWSTGQAAGPSAMPLIGESAAPWLFSSIIIGALLLLLTLRGPEVGVTEELVLVIGLAGTMTAGGLVVARSRRVLEALAEEERARPSADELAAPTPVEQIPYSVGMQRWTASMLELIEHAVDVLAADRAGSPEHQALAAAADDTRDLHQLLTVDVRGRLPINDQARLHALGSLWETGQPRIEELAGAADPRWYRRWRARAVADRRLRHGATPTTAADPLPYRD